MTDDRSRMDMLVDDWVDYVSSRISPEFFDEYLAIPIDMAGNRRIHEIIADGDADMLARVIRAIKGKS
jgi:hypothetical protein